MFQYYCLNPISKVGLEKFSDSYTKTETAEEAEGILCQNRNVISRRKSGIMTCENPFFCYIIENEQQTRFRKMGRP